MIIATGKQFSRIVEGGERERERERQRERKQNEGRRVVGGSTEKMVHLLSLKFLYKFSLTSPFKSPYFALLFKQREEDTEGAHLSGQCVHGPRVFDSSGASDDSQNLVKLE